MPQTIETQDVNILTNFADGELATPTDLVQAQKRMIRDHWSDFLRHRYNPNNEGVADQLRPIQGSLEVKATGSGLEVQVQEGVVLWHEASDPGDPEPRTMLIPVSSQLFTADAADATDDRWDIISAKVEWDNDTGGAESRVFKDQSTGDLSAQSTDKRRRARVTLTYTPGTADPSPSEPAAPAGEVIIARINVTATLATLQDANIHDRRKPSGAIAAPHPLPLFYSLSGSSAIDAGGRLAANAGGDLVVLPLGAIPMLGEDLDRHQRIRKLLLTYRISNGGTGRVRLIRVEADGAPGPTHTSLVDISSKLTFDGSFNHAEVELSASDAISAAWSGGRTYPSFLDGTNRSEYLALEVRFDDAADYIAAAAVDWYGGS